MRRVLIFIVPALLVLAVSCSRLTVDPPVGFAEIKGGRTYQAVSPEGMRYRVRSLKNEPQKDLSFWGDALENHLAKEGYRSAGEAGSFESADRDGACYEWILPMGNQSYFYLTALIVTDKAIILAEAAAPHDVYLRYRQALLDSLATIQPRW
jgi:hypothetical protein